jgi:hypothetical protein
MSWQPPAFQFYAKDWLTSETILHMRPEDEGTFIRLLAASWTSIEPGTLPLPVKYAAKQAGIPTLRLTGYLGRNPTTFIEQDGRLVNIKLHEQWLELKARKAVMSEGGKKGNEKRWAKERSGGDRSASASTSASKDLEPRPDATCGKLEQHEKQPQTARLVPPNSSVQIESKNKNLTPQQQKYAKVRRLVFGALGIVGRAREMGVSTTSADVREELKD